jgi:hypothetical protein
VTTNVTSDYVPVAPVNFDCCFQDVKDVKFEELPLHVPLVNIMSSIDDLRLASLKVDDVQQLIKEQEMKDNQNLYVVATSWGTVLGTLTLISICICCSCCCCKCCRNCFFWLWNKWTPKDCWRQTQEKCCVSIHNYNGARVEYSKTSTTPSPSISVRSLPELGNVVTREPKKVVNENLGSDKELEPIAIRTRSKKMFR